MSYQSSGPLSERFVGTASDLANKTRTPHYHLTGISNHLPQVLDAMQSVLGGPTHKSPLETDQVIIEALW